MAETEPFMVKTVEGDTPLELEADAGTSLMIHDVMVDSPSSNYVTLRTGKTTVGYLRGAHSNMGNHVHFPLTDEAKETLLGLLRQRGDFDGFPVPEGEKFAVTGAAQSSATQAVLYSEHDAGDMTADMPNGMASDEYLFINYGRPSSSPADGDNLIDSSQLPAEFPAFPFGDTVPQRKNIELLGIAASDVGQDTSSGSNQQITKFIKLIQERSVLFDDDRQGLTNIGSLTTSTTTKIGDNLAVVGNFDDVDQRLPWFAPEPIMFTGGEELNVYQSTSVETGSATFSAEDVEMAFIMYVTPAE